MTLSPDLPSLKVHRAVSRRLRKLSRELEKAMLTVSAHFGSKSIKPLMDAQRNVDRAKHVLGAELYRHYPMSEFGNLAGLYFGD